MSHGTDAMWQHIDELFTTIRTKSTESIDRSAELLASAIEADAIIHVGGAGGHSQIPAMEMFYRAGGLANVDIIFGPGLGLFDGRPCLERVPGMGRLTMAYHDVRPEDVVIVCNYYGMNAATVDMALAAGERARAVIGITSTAFAEHTPAGFEARHPSGRNLADVVDVVIDTHTSTDEQVVEVPGVSQKVGVASSLASCMIVQLLLIRTVEICADRGIEAPLFMCANLPGGDTTNEAHLRKYIPRVRHLYPEDESYIGAAAESAEE